MTFDDRLATVLGSPADGEQAARTQFRQLLELLGSVSSAPESDLADEAYRRLEELRNRFPPEEQSRILREPGLRLRNARLVAFLATGEAKPAAAALTGADLGESEWRDLIPKLTSTALGFLRHRRDLPDDVRNLLDGSSQGGGLKGDAGAGGANWLEDMRSSIERIESDPTPAHVIRKEGGTLSALVDTQPGDESAGRDIRPADSFEFCSDLDDRIVWASGEFAPMLEGMRLARPTPGVIAALEDSAATAMRLMQPLRAARLTVDAAPAISGEWRVDAEPVFAGTRRSFAGYRGRIRRPVYAARPVGGETDKLAADRMRQVLHELRTPVSAIQGFAEIIQQQLFGPAPHEYRALAAAVSVDAAKLLAAFDELDRLTNLEMGVVRPEQGDGDLRDVLLDTIRRLEGPLRGRNAGFDIAMQGSPFTTGIARSELLVTCWRVFAGLAGHLAPKEHSTVQLNSDEERITLLIAMPRTIAGKDDPLALSAEETRPAISAGMFGTGFALRLARAEIVAAGGEFALAEDRLTISLPVLTADGATHS